ncbi:hypothetical protein Pelo_861 [Pelomyxa schiedti]|nr:hypothetical protein Pelo_861 [Pelomyxa schiedti]
MRDQRPWLIFAVMFMLRCSTVAVSGDSSRHAVSSATAPDTGVLQAKTSGRHTSAVVGATEDAESDIQVTLYYTFTVGTAAQYSIAIYPVPLSLPTDNVMGAVALVSNMTSAFTTTITTVFLTIYPRHNCFVNGTFVLQFYIECMMDDDPVCDDNLPSFTASLDIYIPDCSQLQNIEPTAWLTIRTYDEQGNFSIAFQDGQSMIIEEIFTVSGVTPTENCECTTGMKLFDWSGNSLGKYTLEDDAELFHTTSLFVSPLENKLSVYLNPGIFNQTENQSRQKP